MSFTIFAFAEISNDELLKIMQVNKADTDQKIAKIDQKISNMDQKISSMDKQLAVVQAELKVQQNIMYIILAGIFGSPFLLYYLNGKREQEHKEAYEKVSKRMEATINVLRVMAQDDDKIAKQLKATGLL